MAKRFIETGIFRKRLLRGLEAPYKALWIYIITECDHAGVWDTANLDIDSIILGHEYTVEGVMEAFGDRVLVVDGKLFIPDFIRYQYGDELNPKNKCHASVIKRLNSLEIDPETLAPTKGLPRGLEGVKDKDKDKDKVQEKDKSKVQEGFITFWNLYPRKVGKRAAEQAWATAAKQKRLPEISTVVSAIESGKRSKQWADPSLIPHPTTWINRDGWNDEYASAPAFERGSTNRPMKFDPALNVW